MALSRSFLKSMGLTEEQVTAIVEANSESLEGIKAERDKYKADADKLPKVQKELEDAKAAAKDSGEYGKLKKEFDDYKAEVAGKELHAKKAEILKEIAKDAGLSEAGIAKVLKYQDFEKIELDDKGAAKDKAQLLKDLKAEWPEYITTTGKKGADTGNPPAGSAGSAGSGEDGNDNRAVQLYNQFRAAHYGNTNESKGDNNK